MKKRESKLRSQNGYVHTHENDSTTMWVNCFERNPMSCIKIVYVLCINKKKGLMNNSIISHGSNKKPMAIVVFS